ncbi:MAG: phage tail assembly chaperone [Sphingorhabdus sp.]
MTIYYSASHNGGLGGFLDDRFFGTRTITVVDEARQKAALARAKEKDDADYNRALSKAKEDTPSVLRSQFQKRQRQVEADPILVEVSNPACRLPADAIEISAEEHGRLLDAAHQGGKTIVPGPDGRPMLTETVPDIDEVLAIARARRDRALAATDWTQLPDAKLSEAKRKLWAAHRQALRDLPAMIEKMDSSAPIDLNALFPQPPQ